MPSLGIHDVREYYGLPEEVVFCKKCVTSNQRPRVEFDENGVCNACNYAHKKYHLIDWTERERRLLDLLDQHRRKDGHYDVIVPCSGGKDSSAVAYKLKYEYGMHPLTVTWAPHIYTDVGWRNFQKFIHSGFDNILGTPNGRVHRTLTRLAFEILGDPFQPFIFGQMTFPFQTALNYRVPLVFYGENGEAEYGGTTANEEKSGPALEDFDKLYFSNIMAERFNEFGISEGDLQAYRMPPLEKLKEANIEMHWFGYYNKWVPQENYYTATEHCGFEANPDGRSEGTYSKYSSLDDRTDGFHFYLGYVKFGMGRATRDSSQEIRSEHITREEAVALVRRYDGEFPKLWFQEFLDYAEITEERFTAVTDALRAPHLWQRENGDWKLRFQVN